MNDLRLISAGAVIPSLNYCDQVYVVQTDDNAWLSVMTTGVGKEGEHGQHLIALRSTDRGQSWSEPVEVEPADGPESSYAVLVKVPGGRIYAFYNHNTDQVKEAPREDGGGYSRVDSLGHYVFKYSDDHGITWSSKRYEIPVRAFAVDRENVTGGTIRFFWNVGRPSITRHGVILPHIKVAAMGVGFYSQSEGSLLASTNLLTEADPEKIIFETLPDGEFGLRTPSGGGRIAEEQSVVELSDGSLYCVYRSVDGWPVCSYSRDGGHTWEPPSYKTYAPGGRRFKHPRAANFVWKCSNGKYLYWFHNHGGPKAARGEWNPFDDRNPVWLVAGHEVDSPEGKRLTWSQPEIFLYDDDPCIRMSYPDLVETEGRYFVTETQKTIARVHEIPEAILKSLFAESRGEIAQNGLLIDSGEPSGCAVPALPPFYQKDYSCDEQPGHHTRHGVTIDFEFALSEWTAHRVLLSTLSTRRKGWEIVTTEDGRLEILLADGRSESLWRSDAGWFEAGTAHQVSFLIDGGPHIVAVLIDGVLHDGGEDRQFGWGRFHFCLTDLNGSPTLTADLAISHLRLYDRALLVNEAVRNSLAVPTKSISTN